MSFTGAVTVIVIATLPRKLSAVASGEKLDVVMQGQDRVRQDFARAAFGRLRRTRQKNQQPKAKPAKTTHEHSPDKRSGGSSIQLSQKRKSTAQVRPHRAKRNNQEWTIQTGASGVRPSQPVTPLPGFLFGKLRQRVMGILDRLETGQHGVARRILIARPAPAR